MRSSSQSIRCSRLALAIVEIRDDIVEQASVGNFKRQRSQLQVESFSRHLLDLDLQENTQAHRADEAKQLLNFNVNALLGTLEHEHKNNTRKGKTKLQSSMDVEGGFEHVEVASRPNDNRKQYNKLVGLALTRTLSL
eukprot:1041534-Rhodomonas_salina.2